MKHNKRISAAILGVAAMIILAGTASARQDDWTEIQPEINACVTAVAEHANYTGATRVRHAITGVKERVVGYKLTIETATYTDTGDAPSREYATSCVVNGDHAPMQFSITETRSGV
jgi:uncharacterized lipoprotein YbaY